MVEAIVRVCARFVFVSHRTGLVPSGDSRGVGFSRSGGGRLLGVFLLVLVLMTSGLFDKSNISESVFE